MTIMMKNSIIILDNGHGQETLGKCSPDGLFKEYRWCRDFVKLLKSRLEYWGYNVVELVPEKEDISLTARANRVNEIYKLHNSCILISIHNNAAGDGSKWYNATGWEAYTSPGNTRSDRLAEILYEEAELKGLKVRKDISDMDADKEANFTILTKTKCPAVLTENMFMDSKKDLEFLNSEDGVKTLIDIHLNAVRRYFEDLDGTHDSWRSKVQVNKCNLK
jgi:N-acetylmuramoyl-L-alanine amidase